MASQAQVIQQKFDKFMRQLDTELSKYPSLNRFDKHLPVPKSYIVCGALAILTFLIFFNICAGFLTNFIGFFVPMYFSLAALETPQPQDDIQWLTYWVVFGFFNFLETFISFVLYWFPFYYTFKTLAIVWLVLPQTQGAKLVYYKLLRPAFLAVHGSQARTPATVDATKPGFSAASTGVHTQ
ncbi:unnamed protein product [Malassezia sympodialis ATCC 42132]|uniref:Protein YOP1 n=1 Tax=Malassezia sympodialis (strain ATCC 42132) TaxID=1230383 RepID=M5EB90_MALS4|nr:uncharacterized protein MSY001_2243 [Malassezia sympodialis ATCC 42132]CCU99537.1 unnamed protein product [Malassezia sympodialis ATCC 42132]SHO78244.1 Similar to S.cerevisiae protein YOP1 (Membrane protein that interacts with Yip1p to mediate membrane traffic) [Malassezia sympodialis ATCC 42132]|eukprot:XP_018740778.1 uncharacterized protein MSY001_2243 [Malassezia sympodialis ATCC 42132]